MICQECHKRPATLHFTKIVNGEKNDYHYCDSCAQEKGEAFMFGDEPDFSINNLLAGLFSFDPSFQQVKKETLPKQNVLQCDNCHMTINQFLNVGRFGCAHCYESFENQLTPLLKRLHSGNVEHRGKVPKRIGGSIHIKKQIQELKQTLQAAIHQEEFERAAEIRDKVRALEGSLHDQRGESS
jgi:protein arginine kinase activator